MDGWMDAAGNAMPSVTHMDANGNTALHYCCQGKGSGMLAQVRE